MKKILLNTVKSTSKHYKKHFALVSDEDYDLVIPFCWSIANQRSGCSYAIGNVNGKRIRMHNFIMGFIGIDHKDGNGLNNQRSNLRKASQHQNNMNLSKIKKGSSEYKGVYFRKDTGKWQAHITFNYKKIRLGCYKTEYEAGRVYNDNAKKYFGRFAKLNQLKNDQIAIEVRDDFNR